MPPSIYFDLGLIYLPSLKGVVISAASFYIHNVQFQSLFCLWIERDGIMGGSGFWLSISFAAFTHLWHSYSYLFSKDQVTKQSGAKIEISLSPKLVSQSTNNTMCQLSTEWGSGDAEAKTTVIVKEQLLFHEVTWMTARQTEWEETENWYIIDVFS